MEGYNDTPGIRKIQIKRQEAKSPDICASEIIAYISDILIETDKPVYDLDDILGITSFIEGLKKDAQVKGQ